MPNIIFLSGIHGTGKTTLGKDLSTRLNIPFASSSDIIKKLSTQNWTQQKRVSGISSNQDILISGIKRFFSNQKKIILDGHFTLLNSTGKIELIPDSTFLKLNLNTIIVCTLDVHAIQKRLYDRDSTLYSFELLNEFQQNEIIQAQKIANQLSIPIFHFNTQADKIDILIDKLL